MPFTLLASSKLCSTRFWWGFFLGVISEYQKQREMYQKINIQYRNNQNFNTKHYISWLSPKSLLEAHAYECACDHMTMIMNNIHGKVNEPRIGMYEEDIYMMKYNEVMVRKI